MLDRSPHGKVDEPARAEPPARHSSKSGNGSKPLNSLSRGAAEPPQPRFHEPFGVAHQKQCFQPHALC